MTITTRRCNWRGFGPVSISYLHPWRRKRCLVVRIFGCEVTAKW